ncbi:hypothetical protein TNIN_381271 [Trichonephila inaurata madagascariensis]|uniref:Uncharacterized protein n=1 Tax=Trichonephila inaurata madagascariensis TaxID=2747483 RepID=A0A8X6YWR5_9ARAC|nr:hypothetical protein TNIN_381271 [Trichonephila inaurata madagascariensis]
MEIFLSTIPDETKALGFWGETPSDTLDFRVFPLQMPIPIRDSPSANKVFDKGREVEWEILLFLTSIYVSLNAAYRERRMWAKVRSSEWWERVVLQSWDDDFKENFRVSR